MGITGTHTGSTLVLHVSGALTSDNAETLRDRIRQAMDDGVVRFVVDLGRAPLVDSTGIGVLVSMHNRLVDAGGAIRLSAVQANVMRILKAAHLDNYIQMFASVADAVADSD